MDKFLTVGFEFCGKLYRSLIMIKKRNNYKAYRITVMNGDLEKILFGNQIIKEVNGCLQIEVSENNEQVKLKTIIAEALSKLLAIPLIKVKF
jgi:hypothetical protein